MVGVLSTEIKRVKVVRLDEGDDLIPTIKRIAIEQGIRSAKILKAEKIEIKLISAAQTS